MTRLFAAIMVTMGLLASPFAVFAQTDPDKASAFVQSVGDDVVSLLGDDSLSTDGRVQELMTLLETHSDLELIGKLAVGKAWRTATPEQQVAYQDVFRGYVMRNLATQMGQYTGQEFRIVGATEVGKRDAQVRTTILQSNGPEITVDWRLRQNDDKLQLIDVAAEGISMVITLREEFSSIVNSRGFDGLIEELRKRSA